MALTGEIPDCVFTLTQMEHLVLHENLLHGTVSRGLNDLCRLQNISLQANRLSGQLPELYDLRELKFLYLQGNRFNGTIPQSISTLGALEKVSLLQNDLTGTVRVRM